MFCDGPIPFTYIFCNIDNIWPVVGQWQHNIWVSGIWDMNVLISLGTGMLHLMLPLSPYRPDIVNIAKIVFKWYWAVAKHILNKWSKNGHRQKGSRPKKNPNLAKYSWGLLRGPQGDILKSFGFFLGRLSFWRWPFVDHLFSICFATAQYHLNTFFAILTIYDL